MAVQGSLQLLAEHPDWTWTEAKGLGSRSSWTSLLQQDGFDSKTISDWLSGKLTAAQLIAKKPITGEGNNSGAGTAASQGVQAVAGAIPGVSTIAGLIGDVTNGSLWKGIGLVLAGGLILIFAAYEFAHMAGVKAAPVPV